MEEKETQAAERQEEVMAAKEQEKEAEEEKTERKSAQEEALEEGSGESGEVSPDGDRSEPSETPSGASYVSHAQKGARISGKLRYENEFTVTWEIYKEFLRALISQYRRIYYIVGCVSLAAAAFVVLTGSGNSVIFLLCVAILSFALPNYSYGGSKKKKFARLVEKNDGNPLKRKVRFYASGLEVFSDKGAHTVLSYKDITKVISSRKIYVLVIRKETSVLVAKDSFTVGDLEGWKNFMITKGFDSIK